MKARLLSLLPIILCVAILMSGCVEQPPVPYDVYEGEIITQQPVHIDTETHTLRFGKDAVLTYGKNQIPIGGKSYDISGAKDGDRLYYHPDTQRVYPFDAHQAICLGVYRKPAILTELNMDSSLLYVNGRNAAILTELRTKKVVCLGDSMTIGHTDSPRLRIAPPSGFGSVRRNELRCD